MYDIAKIIQTTATMALPMVLAITMHEAAKGYAANYFGDKTAATYGRLSLNPSHHIDPIGTLLLPIGLYMISAGTVFFGYAKPVPVELSRLKNPEKDAFWVLFSGPLANFLMALVWGILTYALKALQVNEHFFNQMAQMGLAFNVMLFTFYLLPIPPLPGGKMLMHKLPFQYAQSLAQIEPYGFFIVMALAFSNILGPIWTTPISNVVLGVIQLLLSPLIVLVG